MRIERIKINNGDRVFEESFSTSDNLICVLDNEKIFRSDYKNVFKKNMLDLFRVGSYVEGIKFFTEADVSLLNGLKYTINARGEVKEEYKDNVQKGVTSIISRSCFEVETGNTKKRNKAKLKEDIIDLFNLSHSSSLICFEDDDSEDIDIFSGSFMYGKYDEEIENIAREYFKENLPITFSNGDELYMREPSNRNDNSWEALLVDKNGDKYDSLENSTGVNLMFFIIMHNLIQKLGENVKEDFNYPVFIIDSFDYVENEYFDDVMKALKNMNKQVFIILPEPDKAIQDYCDKTIEFYYSNKK